MGAKPRRNMKVLSLVLCSVAIFGAIALPSPDEWLESGSVQHCTESELDVSSAEEAEAAGETCTVISLCHAMQQLDAKRQDQHLPDDNTVDSQKSYYSAYKCKANMVDASDDAAQETVKSSTGAMCTANSPGMITTTNTACGRVLAGFRGTVNHGKLFDWITNRQGPTMWSAGNHAAMCYVERRGRKKYALADCSKLTNKDEVFTPCTDAEIASKAAGCSYDPYEDSTARALIEDRYADAIMEGERL